MKKPTIQQIKEYNQLFFSRDTLRFFGQTMKDFKVVKSPKNRIFIYAKMKDYNDHFMGYTFRECIVKSDNIILQNVRDNNNSLVDDDYLNNILDFIQEH